MTTKKIQPKKNSKSEQKKMPMGPMMPGMSMMKAQKGKMKKKGM